MEEIRNLTKNLKVLLVEDEDDVREQMKNLFLLFFEDVDEAKDGKEALEKIEKKEYDIIFSDICMPNMNGLELLKKVKEKNPTQKFILITAYNNTEYLLEAIENGVDGFLIKPLNAKKFLFLLKRLAVIIKNEKLEKDFNKKLQEELEKKIKEIEYNTYYDKLTGLKNRTALLKEIENKDFIILLDINNFDSINIVYGYEKGDELLSHVASHLKKFEDVYYLGNDEFAILKEVDIDKIEVPGFKVDEIHEMPIDFTMGIARGDNLLKKAYLALKEAKKQRKKMIVYSKDLDIEKFQIKVHKYLPILKEALKKRDIVPFFQGIFDNKLKKITKYEVLARILHNGKYVTPANFIDIAEKGGLIIEITKQIIDKSFEVFSKNSYEFSINLTDIDLINDELIYYLLDKTKEYNISKSRIVLEVLEGIGDIENTLMLDRLKVLEKLGFKISIDDFGTMNSNFERVTLLNVDYIKIDGKFIKNLDKDKKSFAIVKAITDFSKSIGAKVIAEFVNSEEIQKIIENLGIDYSQGYLFSEPKGTLE